MTHGKLRTVVIRTLTVIVLALFAAFCHADRKLDDPKSKDRVVKCKGREYYIDRICEDEKEYLKWAAAYPKYKTLGELTTKVLARLTRETKDVDKATALFYHRTITDPVNKAFVEYLDKKQKELKEKRPDYSSKKILFAVAPGMFYKDNPNVGADGISIRKIARELGLMETVIPTDQTGTIEQNARFICKFVEKQTNVSGIILASASKGASDIKKAIQICGKKPFFAKVRGWYNLGGINKGSHLIAAMNDTCRYHWEARSYFCWHGYNWEGLQSIRIEKGGPLDFKLEIPPTMLTINVIPLPLFRFVTPRARPFYLYLTRFGPNDGMSLLGDIYIPGVITYGSWRNDHYFRFPIYEYRMMAFLNYIVEKQFP